VALAYQPAVEMGLLKPTSLVIGIFSFDGFPTDIFGFSDDPTFLIMLQLKRIRLCHFSSIVSFPKIIPGNRNSLTRVFSLNPGRKRTGIRGH